jgi:hypothetical protein
MNKVVLLAGAPDDTQWAAMSPADKQTVVVNLAVAALNECAAHGQQLDAWESYYLRSALGSVYTNYLSLAWSEVVKALAGRDERAPGWEGLLASEIPTVDEYRAAFEQVRHHLTAPQ